MPAAGPRAGPPALEPFQEWCPQMGKNEQRWARARSQRATLLRVQVAAAVALSRASHTGFDSPRLHLLTHLCSCPADLLQGNGSSYCGFSRPPQALRDARLEFLAIRARTGERRVDRRRAEDGVDT